MHRRGRRRAHDSSIGSGACGRACPRAIGEQQERRYLQSVACGNADPSGGIDRFWPDDGARNSAEEQIAFLQRL